MSPGRRLVRRIGKLARGHLRSTRGRLGARFEYSMLPVDGGHVLPHTDAPGKIVTIIVSILDDDEWDPAFGGGTDINRPVDPPTAETGRWRITPCNPVHTPGRDDPRKFPGSDRSA